MATNIRTKRPDLIYPDLSYKIVGSLFSTFEALGPGHREVIYQRGLAEILRKNNISFKEQVYAPVKIGEVLIGKSYLDFLIEDCVIIEIKARSQFSQKEIKQLYEYLKSLHLQLGMLVHFTSDGVRYKRILNLS